jgi:hypothetical protein
MLLFVAGFRGHNFATIPAGPVDVMCSPPIIIPAGEPGKNGTVTSFCPFNTGLAGGAYRKDPNAVIVNSAPTAQVGPSVV